MLAFEREVRGAVLPLPSSPSGALSPQDEGVRTFLEGCAEALRRPGAKPAIYAAGAATLSRSGNFEKVGKIAAACGAKLYCESLFTRLDRGVGAPHASRLPYFPQE